MGSVYSRRLRGVGEWPEESWRQRQLAARAGRCGYFHAAALCGRGVARQSLLCDRSDCRLGNGKDADRSQERRVGKEGRYWRDWSSDVCSSDLVWVFSCRCVMWTRGSTAEPPLRPV